MNISIIIPIHNEEQILEKQIRSLTSALAHTPLPGKYEILLIENGSSDNTLQIAKKLSKQLTQLRIVTLKKASYGQAFKKGLQDALHEIIVQFDIDFWTIKFINKALMHIEHFDIVIGSKNMRDSHDRRSFLRVFLSRLIEKAIQWNFKVDITDTHGLKMIRKDKVLPVIQSVHSPNHFFDTELLIRSIRQGASFTEFPVDLREIRSSRFSFLKRSVSVISEFSRLMFLKNAV